MHQSAGLQMVSLYIHPLYDHKTFQIVANGIEKIQNQMVNPVKGSQQYIQRLFEMLAMDGNNFMII